MRTEPQWLQALGGVLRQAIPAGRTLPRESLRGGPDLRMKVRGRLLLLKLERVRGPRIQEVQGRLAKAVLELGRPAAGLPVAVVALSRFGAKLEQAVRAFMEEYAPGFGWGLMDEHGQAVLVVPGLGLDWARDASEPNGAGRIAERGDRKLFTDLNRWMLKVLLLENAPDELWGGPRQRPRHPTELAAVAGVSVGKAHDFAAAFRARGFLRKSRAGLRLANVPELLESWLQDEKNSSPKAVLARALLPPSSAEEESVPVPPSAWDSVALGGAFAARQAGLLRVSGRILPLVHATVPIRRAIPDWQLEECDARDAQILLSEPLYPNSVFRGRVLRPDGPPLVDLVQIALDSISSPARGREQADFVVEQVLALGAFE